MEGSDSQTMLKATRLALDNYDDIFSDFDISPYSRRLLSYDFLTELRRRYAETKTGEVSVSFTLPRSQRSQKTESLVRKRLKDHFRQHLRKVESKIGESRKKGLFKISAGLAASILLFSFTFPAEMPLTTMLSVLSWYFLWTGYSDIFETTSKNSSKREFYKKFLDAKYEFFDEEEYLLSLCEPLTAPQETQKGSS